MALLLVLAPDGVGSALSGKAAPELHYLCQVERRTEAGTFRANRTVDAAGKLVQASITWSGPQGMMPEMGAGWVVAPAQELDLTRGYATFDIGGAPGFDRTLKGRFTLELSTSASPQSLGATLKGRAAQLSYRRHAFPDLSVEWADAVALARGASSLFLNARDRYGRLLRSWEIGRNLLLSAEKEAAAAQREAIAITAQSKDRCQPFDPAEMHIVIAS